MANRIPTGQATGLPTGITTGNRQETDRAALSVGEAARQLGVTPDAIRSRLHRGTLPGEKVAGEWRVFLPRQDAPTGNRQDGQSDARQDGRQPATGTKQDGDGLRQATDRQPYEALVRAKDETINRLDDEVSYLRAQLEQANRERAAERERFDIIHREALNRIEALTAGVIQEPIEHAAQASGAPEPAFRTGAQDGPGAPIETMMADDPFPANGASRTPLRDHDVTILATQLIEELGMEPEAAMAAAADELGIEYGD